LLKGKLYSYTFLVVALPGASFAVIVASEEQFAMWEQNLSAARFICIILMETCVAERNRIAPSKRRSRHERPTKIDRGKRTK